MSWRQRWRDFVDRLLPAERRDYGEYTYVTPELLDRDDYWVHMEKIFTRDIRAAMAKNLLNPADAWYSLRRRPREWFPHTIEVLVSRPDPTSADPYQHHAATVAFKIKTYMTEEEPLRYLNRWAHDYTGVEFHVKRCIAKFYKENPGEQQ